MYVYSSKKGGSVYFFKNQWILLQFDKKICPSSGQH